MTDDEFFESQFPGAPPLLKELRAGDREFDRICTDYKEVFAELALPPKPQTVPQMRYLADLAESLADLRCSIDARLQAHRADTGALGDKD